MPKRSRQRRGQKTGAGGGADQGERRQVEFDRPGCRALADHDVDLEILHRRIQHFLDHGREAMDLVDEQHIVRLQVGQQRRQVAGFLDHRARGHAQVHAQLVGDHMAQRCLAEAGRPEDQHVVQRLAAPLRRLDVDVQLFAHRLLAEILVQPLRPDAGLDGVVFAGGGGIDDAVGGHDGIMDETAAHSSRQISTCAPNSTRRLPGMRKKPVAGAALRCMAANSLSRQIGMPPCRLATTVSRLAK